jgi:hypothetical protein
MDIGKELTPDQIQDSQSDVNPAHIPKMIWMYLEPYFTKTYDLNYVDAFPDKAVDRPTITWRMFHCKPGGGERGVMHSRGPTFSGTKKITPEGSVIEEYRQQFMVTYEFAVFGTSNAQVDDIAWDLHNGVLQTVGLMQEQLTGFTCSFLEQIGDSTLLWRAQDELMIRTLRFICTVPVRYSRVLPQLRFFHKTIQSGRMFVQGSRVTRTDSDPIYYVPVDEDKKVVGIVAIFLMTTSNLQPLLQGTDYQVLKDEDNEVYIRWEDDYGKVPAVGEDFRVDYEVSQIITSSDVNTQL